MPGNHDVGDNDGGHGSGSALINPGRRERWLSLIGPDQWTTAAMGD